MYIVKKYLFIATGNYLPHIPDNIPGIKTNAIGYEDIPMDLNYYKNKKVAIIGGKNSGFEIASYISEITASTHIIVNKNPRFAFDQYDHNNILCVFFFFLFIYYYLILVIFYH